MSKNKIKFGLKNVHWAVVTLIGNKLTFGQINPMHGGVNLALNPQGEEIKFFADNIPYFVTTSNQGYEGTLEVAIIPDNFRIDVMKDRRDNNGAIIENANVVPNNIALLFEFDGDQNETRHVLYNVAVARPSVEGETKTENITPKTEILNISAAPDPETGNVKARLDKGMPGYDTFFESIYIEDQTKNIADESNIEYDTGDVEFTITSVSDNNSVRNVRLNSISIPGIYVTVTPDGVNQLGVTIAEGYITTLDVGKHSIVVELEKGNAIVVELERGD